MKTVVKELRLARGLRIIHKNIECFPNPHLTTTQQDSSVIAVNYRVKSCMMQTLSKKELVEKLIVNKKDKVKNTRNLKSLTSTATANSKHGPTQLLANKTLH